MTAIIEVRTPPLIAAEIRSIDSQTREIVLRSAMEIGKRLNEVKALVGHGEWGDWLTDNVNYSQSTANNFMRVAEEYGSNFQALENLNYSQAVALLAVPTEEREQFAADVGADNLSTRALKEAVKAKQDAEKRAKNLEADLKKIRERAEQERKEREALQGHVSQLQVELADAKIAGNAEEAEKLQSDLANALAKVKSLETELIAKPIDVTAIVEKIPEDVKAELVRLRRAEKNGKQAAKFSAGWELLNKGFNDVLSVLDDTREADPEAHEKFRAAVTGMIGKMSERLGG